MIKEIRDDVEERAVTFFTEIKNEIFSVPIGREKDFDFGLTITQIFVVQLSSYISLGVFLSIFSFTFGQPPHLDQIFFFRSFGDTATILAWVCNGLFNSIWLYLYVRRSKKVLDFTLTLYFVHFLVSLVYSFTLPLNIHWYIVMVINLIQMYVLGKNLCYLKESRVVDIGPTKIRASDRERSKEISIAPYRVDEKTGKCKMSPRPKSRELDEPLDEEDKKIDENDSTDIV